MPQSLRLRANQRVAFRMSDDERKPEKLQAVQSLLDRRRNGEIGEFDEQVLLLVNRVVCGTGTNLLKVLHTEVKIAPCCQVQAVPHPGLQLVAPLAHKIEIKAVFAIRVGRSYNVRDTVRYSHFRHFQSLIERLRAVIEPRKNMTVNVN